jgi:short-subunit dehydrogenase
MQEPGSVLITGATGGIGAALALAYARPGRTLFLHGRREERLRELAAECAGRGAKVETQALDLVDTAALIAWVETLAGKVDLAVVNAGVTSNVRDGEAWAEIDHVLQVNLRAALATATALAPPMRRRGAARSRPRASRSTSSCRASCARR